MRAVIQVVSQASVTVEKQRIGEITGPGLMILLGVHVDDTQKQADALVNKILNLRILGEKFGVGTTCTGSSGVVHAICRCTKGRRPSWSKAVVLSSPNRSKSISSTKFAIRT